MLWFHKVYVKLAVWNILWGKPQDLMLSKDEFRKVQLQWSSLLELTSLSQLFWDGMINTLRLRQNGHHFADHTFKCIFLNENVRISIKISLKCVPMGPMNNIPALVQIMAWRRPGDKPLSESMMVSLPTHICVTRPQWVKQSTKDLEVSVTLPATCKSWDSSWHFGTPLVPALWCLHGHFL